MESLLVSSAHRCICQRPTVLGPKTRKISSHFSIQNILKISHSCFFQALKQVVMLQLKNVFIVVATKPMKWKLPCHDDNVVIQTCHPCQFHFLAPPDVLQPLASCWETRHRKTLSRFGFAPNELSEILMKGLNDLENYLTTFDKLKSCGKFVGKFTLWALRLSARWFWW